MAIFVNYSGTETAVSKLHSALNTVLAPIANDRDKLGSIYFNTVEIVDSELRIALDEKFWKHEPRLRQLIRNAVRRDGLRMTRTIRASSCGTDPMSADTARGYGCSPVYANMALTPYLEWVRLDGEVLNVDIEWRWDIFPISRRRIPAVKNMRYN